MPDVKDIINLLAEQETQRIHQQEQQAQCEIARRQRSVDIEKLRDELLTAQRNRDYLKSVLIEQLQRDSSSHGEVIFKLLSDTFEAIFLWKYPEADNLTLSLQQQIEALQQ
ncbi:hypothetical protein EIC82_06310 [Enterobacter sp. A11]|uniref:hypothetical protein n=1 Tax=unclassified Enterobacter TaxID=2608935 RepID=UPI00106F4717|nr:MULTISPECIES: hypothetical protein [unclassified Enterobacter]MBM1019744.1 hypothetical protein [Enterobacter sp. E1]MEA3561043.1 hypothetical protein [Enterobacter sp. GM-22]MEA3595660.1 hypothetical protein [Enterobacter sp. GM-31]TFF60774.1 hypothetical protein EIC82_06310 [Enterobacter sp. A11]